MYDGLASYNSYRFQMFYDAISAKYPDIEIIASTNVWTYQKGNSAGDYHDYSVSTAPSASIHYMEYIFQG